MLNYIIAFVVTIGMTQFGHAEPWNPAHVLWKCWSGDLAVEEMPLSQIQSLAAPVLGLSEASVRARLREFGIVVSKGLGAEVVSREAFFRNMSLFVNPKSLSLVTAMESNALIMGAGSEGPHALFGPAAVIDGYCSASIHPGSVMAQKLLPASKMIFKETVEAFNLGSFGSMWVGFLPEHKSEVLLLAQSEREGRPGVFLLRFSDKEAVQLVVSYTVLDAGSDTYRVVHEIVSHDEKLLILSLFGVTDKTLSGLMASPALAKVLRVPCFDAYRVVNGIPALEPLPAFFGDMTKYGFNEFVGGGGVDYEQTLARLAGKGPGSYLVRLSQSEKNGAILAFVDAANKVQQTIVKSVSPGSPKVKCSGNTFPSLLSVILAYRIPPSAGIPALLRNPVSPYNYGNYDATQVKPIAEAKVAVHVAKITLEAFQRGVEAVGQSVQQRKLVVLNRVIKMNADAKRHLDNAVGQSESARGRREAKDYSTASENSVLALRSYAAVYATYSEVLSFLLPGDNVPLSLVEHLVTEADRVDTESSSEFGAAVSAIDLALEAGDAPVVAQEVTLRAKRVELLKVMQEITAQVEAIKSGLADVRARAT